MPASRLQAAKNFLIYRGLLASSAIGSRLSLTRARSIGRFLGGMANATLRKEKVRAHRSLATAFPTLASRERDRIIAAMFAHLGQSLMEIAWLPNLNRSNLGETTLFEGLEYLEAAVRGGKGVVLFTAHCGNWEWLGSALGILGFDMHTIAREIYDTRLNEFIVLSRARHGTKSIGRGSGSSAREILRALRRRGVLCLLIDQSIDAESVPIPFFGHPAPTPIGAAKLTIRSGATAVAGFIERRNGMQVLRFEPPIPTSRDDDPAELTAHMTRSIEEQIRRVPEQWVWMHQRWRERR